MGFLGNGPSLPGLPGLPGVPGVPGISPIDGPNDGTGNQPQPTKVQVISRTMITSAHGSIPATTAGNTLVACLIAGSTPYINSTGATVGTDPNEFLTIYDGTPFYGAFRGPVN